MKKFVATTAAALFAVGALAGCTDDKAASTDSGAAQSGTESKSDKKSSGKAYTTEELNQIIGKVNGANGPLQPAAPGENPDISADQIKQMVESMPISPAECKEQARKNMAGGATTVEGIPSTTAADTSGEGAAMSVLALTLIDGSDESVKKAGGPLYPEKSTVQGGLAKCGKITIGPEGQGMEVTTTVEDTKVSGSDDSYATKTSMNIAGQAREQYTVWAKKGSLIASSTSGDVAESKRLAEEAVAQAS